MYKEPSEEELREIALSHVHVEMKRLLDENSIAKATIREAYKNLLEYEYIPAEIRMDMADKLNLIKSNWNKFIFILDYAPTFFTFMYYLLKKKENMMKHWKSTVAGIILAVMQAIGGLWTTGHLTWETALTAIITAIFGFVVSDPEPKKKKND